MNSSIQHEGILEISENSVMTINDIIQLRKDIAEGNFQGILQTHKVESGEDRLEANPRERFFTSRSEDSLN